MVDKLSAVILKSMNSGALRKRAETYGQTLVGGTPEDFAKTIKTDLAKWKDVVERSGAKLE
mgnify:CR=1 FL=1